MRRGVALTIYHAILVPWYLVAALFVLMTTASEIAIAFDERVQDALEPIHQKWESCARRTANFLTKRP